VYIACPVTNAPPAVLFVRQPHELLLLRKKGKSEYSHMLIWSPLQIDGEHMGSGGEVRDSNFEWIRLEQELMGSEQKLIQIHYIALIDRSLDRCESCLTSE